MCCKVMVDIYLRTNVYVLVYAYIQTQKIPTHSYHLNLVRVFLLCASVTRCVCVFFFWNFIFKLYCCDYWFVCAYDVYKRTKCYISCGYDFSTHSLKNCWTNSKPKPKTKITKWNGIIVISSCRSPFCTWLNKIKLSRYFFNFISIVKILSYRKDAVRP